MGLSFWQIALVAVLFLLLFGRGKIPQLMGDIAEGIKSFREGMSRQADDHSEVTSEPPPRLTESSAPLQPGVEAKLTERQ